MGVTILGAPLFTLACVCSGNKYVLKMRFLDHIFDNFVVDHMRLKVILPEGAK